MKRTWTIIGVADVPQSFKWYQSLLGLLEKAPAHDDFGQIVDLGISSDHTPGPAWRGYERYPPLSRYSSATFPLSGYLTLLSDMKDLIIHRSDFCGQLSPQIRGWT
jgi:hypothetical protein